MTDLIIAPELAEARLKAIRAASSIWGFADRCGLYEPKKVGERRKIRKKAKQRVLRYLAAKLGVKMRYHMFDRFDLATCERAIEILQGIDYRTIRDFDMQRDTQEAA